PVVLAAEESTVRRGDADLFDGAGVRPRLKEKHPGARVLGEPGGYHAARAPAAYDHVVEHTVTLSAKRCPTRAIRGPAVPREPPAPGIGACDYRMSLSLTLYFVHPVQYPAKAPDHIRGITT